MKPGQVTIRQWFALPPAERQLRAVVYRAADDALQAYRNPDRVEDDTWHRLNDTLDDLEPTVPWWIREPALPHPGTRTGAALNAAYAVAALALTILIALTLATP